MLGEAKRRSLLGRSLWGGKGGGRGELVARENNAKGWKMNIVIAIMIIISRGGNGMGQLGH